LEVGSRIVNGTVRSLFTGCEYVGIDVVAGDGVDVVADGAHYESELFDCVVCTEVLEHAENAAGICENVSRLLRPGGYFLVTAAAPPRTPHSVDGGPLRDGEFYRNITVETLFSWLDWASLLSFERDDGDVRVLAKKKKEIGHG
jgi:SAM-dependent methyltransferase